MIAARASSGVRTRFRGITAAAELKLVAQRKSISSTSCFRGITAAAELKLHMRSGCDSDAIAFPRHNSRGRIEALDALRYIVAWTAGFRGITAAAELKRLAAPSPEYQQDRVSAA